ncbi:Mth938-like domain-containing protein [Neisseria animalis]|uniref:Rod shape-determining protein RodA n=1 Tax=Neisseria animalis TaxID=492 RepID=A0A5P3MT81_NEIAN|nr:MTH938/NDUFAF3 family protein [Neisseria animalis]QEY24774.1 rod shape-determining protein RodA [Neisseria animalis]ROW31825.1 rod shape-determining protein RodA [Neisseria animalis]VEE07743.1 Protein of uncharacterised function (DUF498/DUF598) [Neisseria animalis]
MLIQENTAAGADEAAVYRPGRIEIGRQLYTQAVALCHGKTVKITQQKPSDLVAADFLQTAEGQEKPELIIVGTGEKQQFLHPKVAADLAAQGIGLECMNTAAACRTLLLLKGEGRSVWAWLWP